MSTTRPGRRLLEGIVEIFRPHRDDDAPAATPGDATDVPNDDAGFTTTATALDDVLADLKSQAEARRQAALRQRAVDSGHVGGLDEAGAEDVKARRLEEVHARIRAKVLETHAALGTGVDDAALTRLCETMDDLHDVMTAGPGAGVEAYVRARVARRIFDETGAPAWSRLTRLMETAGREWPASDPNLREHQRAEAAEMFVHASPIALINLLTGVVGVWQDHYPDPGSPLWEGVCLRACGAALRARMLARAIEYLRDHGEALRAEGESLMRQEIEAVRTALASGVHSVEQADRIMAGASGLLEQILPDLCWDRVRELVESDS